MMVSLMSLWLPILVGAVLVFIVSSIVHMVLGYHWNDYGQVPKQGQVAAALRPFAIPPGDYMLPKPDNPKAMRTPEFKEKVQQGPVLSMTVYPSNQMTMMTKQLVQWFIYCAVVGLFAGYVAGRTLGAGAEYLQVFRVTGTVAFCGYGLALLQASIWYGRRWSTTLISLADALVYGLVTGGAFGWLWPS